MKTKSRKEYEEAVALIKAVQKEARRVLAQNGGKDIRFIESGKVIFPGDWKKEKH